MQRLVEGVLWPGCMAMAEANSTQVLVQLQIVHGKVGSTIS